MNVTRSAKVQPLGVEGASLNEACQTSQLSNVQKAIGAGAKPDAQTLTWACLSKNVQIIDAVSGLGAKPDDKTLTAACSTHQLAIVEKALKLGAKGDDKTLEIANQSGNNQIINLIKSKGALPTGTNNGNNELTRACQAKSLELVNRAIAQGARPEKYTLSWAVGSRDPKIVEAVIKAGAKPHMDPNSASELSAACEVGILEVVKAVIKTGAKPDAQTLTWGYLSGNIEIVEAVIEIGATLDDETLNAACSTGKLQLVTKALGQGAKATEKALEAAQKSGNNSVVALIKSHMASTEKLSKNKEEEVFIPLDLASGRVFSSKSKKGVTIHPDFLSKLNTMASVDFSKLDKNGNNELTSACISRNLDLVKRAIAKGIRPQRYTLREAIGREAPGDYEMVRSVIAAGALPHEDPNRTSELTAACATGNPQIVEAVIGTGAKADMQTVYQARFWLNQEIVDLLRASGFRVPDLDDKTISYFTAMHDGKPGPYHSSHHKLDNACRNEDLTLVKRLIAEGGIPSKYTLYWAVHSGDVEIVRAVVKEGAKSHGDYTKVFSELTLACLKDYIVILKELHYHKSWIDFRFLDASRQSPNIELWKLADSMVIKSLQYMEKKIAERVQSMKLGIMVRDSEKRRDEDRIILDMAKKSDNKEHRDLANSIEGQWGEYMRLEAKAKRRREKKCVIL